MGKSVFLGLANIGPAMAEDLRRLGVHSIEDLFPVRVDVSNRVALKPHVRPFAERDAVYAF